jgi:hypothetical protein
MGYQSAQTTQGTNAVSLGSNAGASTQSSFAVAVGDSAGNSAQGSAAVAVGSSAGLTNQGLNAIAVGANAGQSSQGNNSVAIGINAGLTSQGVNTVAVGNSAGKTSQSSGACALGFQAGQTSQASMAVAIGYQAGISNQGLYSIALGAQAGAATNIAAYSVCIGASCVGSSIQGSLNFGSSMQPTTNISGTGFIPLAWNGTNYLVPALTTVAPVAKNVFYFNSLSTQPFVNFSSLGMGFFISPVVIQGTNDFSYASTSSIFTANRTGAYMVTPSMYYIGSSVGTYVASQWRIMKNFTYKLYAGPVDTSNNVDLSFNASIMANVIPGDTLNIPVNMSFSSTISSIAAEISAVGTGNINYLLFEQIK